MRQIKPDYFAPRDRILEPWPDLWNSESETDPTIARLYGERIRRIWNYFEAGRVTIIYSRAEWKALEQSVLERFLKGPQFLGRHVRLHRNACRRISETVAAFDRADLSTATRCRAWLKKLKTAWIALDQVNVNLWYVGGEALAKHLSTSFKKRYPLLGDRGLATLTSPTVLAFTTEEEIAAAEAAVRVGKGSPLSREGNALAKKFGAIPFGYDGPTVWDRSYYEKHLRKLARTSPRSLTGVRKHYERHVQKTVREQERLEKLHRILPDDSRLLATARTLHKLTDERKRYHCEVHLRYANLLGRFSDHTGLTLAELKRVSDFEIGTATSPARLRKLKALSAVRSAGPLLVLGENGKLKIFTGSRALLILEKLTEEQKTVSWFGGTVASRGSSSLHVGKVQIILNPNGIGAMQRGRILVTGMTTPDFIVGMRKASAIITDEGGVTCHAAIVSRELNIPCIISTQVATRTLKDGDTVSMDTVTGKVTILKRLKR